MGKQADNKASGEVNSRILLMILEELRSIRKQMDTALSARGADNNTPAEAPAEPPAPEEPPAEAEIAEPTAPLSPEEESKLVSSQGQRIEGLMSVAQFTQAEKVARELLQTLPDSTEAQALLDTVGRESSAFCTEQQSRLFSEFQRFSESRQWIKALDVGEQLIEKYPASTEAQTLTESMTTVRKNAHFEEARELRDRIGNLIKRKRYPEAVEIAEDLMRRFPNTQVAKQLTSLLPDLKRRSADPR
jgi:tetratricopeptide (TPR) repeat protein